MIRIQYSIISRRLVPHVNERTKRGGSSERREESQKAKAKQKIWWKKEWKKGKKFPLTNGNLFNYLTVSTDGAMSSVNLAH